MGDEHVTIRPFEHWFFLCFYLGADKVERDNVKKYYKQDIRIRCETLAGRFAVQRTYEET